MLEMFSFEFVQNALIAAVLVAIACGVMGSYVVVNKIAGTAGGVAHASFGGIGLACFFGFSPMLGALGVALVCALIMGYLTWTRRELSDTLINVIWAGGMAMGVILTDLTPGYSGDMMSFLFGSILTVPRELLFGMTMLTVGILAVSALFFRQFLVMSLVCVFGCCLVFGVAALYAFDGDDRLHGRDGGADCRLDSGHCALDDSRVCSGKPCQKSQADDVPLLCIFSCAFFGRSLFGLPDEFYRRSGHYSVECCALCGECGSPAFVGG